MKVFSVNVVVVFVKVKQVPIIMAVTKDTGHWSVVKSFHTVTVPTMCHNNRADVALAICYEYWSGPFLTQLYPVVVVHNRRSDQRRVVGTAAIMINTLH